MIFGIGVDLCEISRIEHSYQKFADKFAQKILTENEFTQFKQRSSTNQSSAAQFLASRFAAKEAAVKALGTGFTQGIGFHSIEISNQTSGQPELSFYDNALKIVQSKGIKSHFISLSDERKHVVAMVVLEV